MAGQETHAADSPTMFFISLVVGATVVVLLWLMRRNKEQPTDTRDKTAQKKRPADSSKHSGNKANKKKQTVWRKPAASVQFTHPELVTSLKGHTGSLTSGGFSANGKHFLSAAEVGHGRRFDPGGGARVREVEGERAGFSVEACGCGSEDGGSSSFEEIDTSSISSSSQVATSNAPSDAEEAASTAKMSRRQRKNKNKKGKGQQERPWGGGRVVESTSALFEAAGKSENQLHHLLLPLCCGVEERVLNGYPYVTSGGVQVFRAAGYSTLASALAGTHRLVEAERTARPGLTASRTTSLLDAEDTTSDYSEPESLVDLGTSECCSDDHDANDTSSGVSSDSKESEADSQDGFPWEVETGPGQQPAAPGPAFQRVERCKRCRQSFDVNDNGRRPCDYHPKKVWLRRDGQLRHQCCSRLKGAAGCMRAAMHVYHSLRAGLNGPLEGYVTARGGGAKVLGLDCEMVFTTEGFEVARVTLVRITGRLVLDTFVRPRGRVFDYNTQFSGITEAHMEGAVSFTEAREKVLAAVTASTILVGHSLEGDLVALRMVHRNVIDTALLFKATQDSQELGSPAKQPLKSLAKKYLGRDIQSSSAGGHDSVEDATAVLDLVLSHFIESHKVLKVAPLPSALRNM